MNSSITFDIYSFNKDKISLLKFLYSLKYKGIFIRTNEIDEFFSKQPSIAYKYIKNLIVDKKWDSVGWRYFNVEKNRFNEDQEKVFLKNIKFGIAYLSITQQKRFRNSDLQKKFEKKVYKDAKASFDYSTKVLCERIPEEKEGVFLDNYFIMYQYSMRVIKGKYPENIHKQIYLRSFEENNKYRIDCLKAYLKQDDSLVDRRFYGYRT